MKNKPRRIYYRNDKFLAAIGRKIRQARRDKKMTLEELAFKCEDIDYTQIGKMERGEVNFTVSYLFLIARALDVHPKELLPQTNTKRK